MREFVKCLRKEAVRFSKEQDEKVMCHGLMKSILEIIDGLKTYPKITLVHSVTEEEKNDAINNDYPWYEDGTIINPDGCLLSEEYEKMVNDGI